MLRLKVRLKFEYYLGLNGWELHHCYCLQWNYIKKNTLKCEHRDNQDTCSWSYLDPSLIKTALTRKPAEIFLGMHVYTV